MLKSLAVLGFVAWSAACYYLGVAITAADAARNAAGVRQMGLQHAPPVPGVKASDCSVEVLRACRMRARMEKTKLKGESK